LFTVVTNYMVTFCYAAGLLLLPTLPSPGRAQGHEAYGRASGATGASCGAYGETFAGASTMTCAVRHYRHSHQGTSEMDRKTDGLRGGGVGRQYSEGIPWI